MKEKEQSVQNIYYNYDTRKKAKLDTILKRKFCLKKDKSCPKLLDTVLL